MQIVVTPGGVVRCVYDETIDLACLGEVDLFRASHVEPNCDGHWTADLSPVDGPVLGPFDRRSEALAAETKWLIEHWLVRATCPIKLPQLLPEGGPHADPVDRAVDCRGIDDRGLPGQFLSPTPGGGSRTGSGA